MKAVTPTLFNPPSALNSGNPLAALCAGLLSGCAEPPVDLQSRQLSDRIIDWNIRWKSGIPGARVLFSVQEIDGMAAVCGKWVSLSATRTRLNFQSLAAKEVFVNGTPIIKGLGYFNRVSSEAALETAPGNCRTSNVPWQEEFRTAPIDLDGVTRFQA